MLTKEENLSKEKEAAGESSASPIATSDSGEGDNEAAPAGPTTKNAAIFTGSHVESETCLKEPTGP